MSKCLFVAGTATDVGKTFISALIVKTLRKANLNAGYYKAAASGVVLDSNGKIVDGDPIFVNNFANIGEDTENLVSYVYSQPVSPHLAARINDNLIEFSVIERDFNRAKNKYDFLVVEGSGGVVCPLRWEKSERLMVLDIVKSFNLPILLVADAGLGTINSVVLTIDYLRHHKFNVNSIILNHFRKELMERDNATMISQMINVSIVAKVEQGDSILNIDIETLKNLFL